MLQHVRTASMSCSLREADHQRLCLHRMSRVGNSRETECGLGIFRVSRREQMTTSVCRTQISFSGLWRCPLMNSGGHIQLCANTETHWTYTSKGWFYDTWIITGLHYVAAAAAKLLQSCPTLCNPIEGSPPGPSVPGILQARTPEWVAISFSNAWKWKVKVKLLSPVLATPWTAAYQAPPSMGFSRQEYWSGVPLPSPLHYVTLQKLHYKMKLDLQHAINYTNEVCMCGWGESWRKLLLYQWGCPTSPAFFSSVTPVILWLPGVGKPIMGEIKQLQVRAVAAWRY